jgi:hypothetical protein
MVLLLCLNLFTCLTINFIIMNIEKLEFKSVIRFYKFGNEIQRCETVYKNIHILWETFFPFNIFKDPIDTFLVDRIVTVDTKINNAIINENYYTDHGLGYPEFRKLEDAITYIDSLS